MLQVLSSYNGTENRFLVTGFYLLIFFMVAVFAAASYFLLRSKLKLYKIYFLTVLFMGMIFTAVLPPLSAPDEVLHFVGAYELSDKLMLKPSRDADGNVIIRKEDEYIVNWPGDNDWNKATVIGQTLDSSVYKELYNYGFFVMKEEGESITLQQPVATTPLAYLMPAIGITLARLLRLSCFGLLFLGRFMNLLLFAVLGALSVKRTPVGKKVFFAVSLFPMTLEIAGSYSYDSYIMALSFYLTAVILDHAVGSENREISLSDTVEMGILAVLLSPCKMIYATLFALCLTIPIKKWKKPGFIRWCMTVLLIGALIIGSIILVNLREVLRYVNASGVTQAPEFTSSGEVNSVKLHDLSELILDKTLVFRIIRNTFQILGAQYLGTTVGMWLGAFDRGLATPVPFLFLFWTAAIFTGAYDPEEPVPEIWKRLIMAGTAAFLTFILLTSMLLSYTPADTFYILGVQGRYFLPCLPVLLLCFRSKWVKTLLGKLHITPAIPKLFLLSEILMNGIVLAGCYLTVISRVL